MGKDYFLYIHGVNTREQRVPPTYADPLIARLQNRLPASEHIPLYWGDVNVRPESDLVKALNDNPKWSRFWFRNLREHQIMRFVGDAALYISRAVGSRVVDALYRQAVDRLKAFDAGADRLHLITHSWGTVILFDVLFAPRWLNRNMPGSGDVQEIRDALFGLGAHPEKGAPITTVHTMGSPLPIFTLFDAGPAEDPRFTHDITPSLQTMLQRLEARTHRPTPWRNFAHPGDPIAYPIETILPALVDPTARLLDLQDVLTRPHDIADVLTGDLFSQQALAVWHGGTAHGSYWDSDEVANAIIEVVPPAAIRVVPS